MFQYDALNLMDESAISKVVESFHSDYIIHLDSMSSVRQSWKEPAECFNNTGIFLNLIEAVRCSVLQQEYFLLVHRKNMVITLPRLCLSVKIMNCIRALLLCRSTCCTGDAFQTVCQELQYGYYDDALF